jgi:hypothetical protein
MRKYIKELCDQTVLKMLHLAASVDCIIYGLFPGIYFGTQRDKRKSVIDIENQYRIDCLNLIYM